MIKPLYFFFFVIVCLLGLMACSARPQDKFKNLTADEFDRLIQDENVQRVDVRTVAEYSEGHIPGHQCTGRPFCRCFRRNARQRPSCGCILQKRTQKPERRPHPYQLRI